MLVDERTAELRLDPFDFQRGWRSAIGGLGGTTSPTDPAYAFHTPYVEAAPGICNFTVRFTGLAARYGSLQLRVHMIALNPGEAARPANMDRIALNRLVQLGGEVSIRFEGFRGYAFALMGLVPDETDAQADALVITLDRPLATHEATQDGGDGRTSAYGRDAARATTHLISAEPPRFAAPVAQVATRPQLAEPDYRAILAEVGDEGDGLGGWPAAFALQSLRRYGMMGPDARGLAIMVPPALATALARGGPEISLAGFGPAANSQEIDPDALPRDLVDFDFLCSVGALGALRSAEAGVRFVEDTMRCLRPGGLAVHLMPYLLDNASRGLPLAGPLYRRGDVERMALLAISREHEAAQLRINATDALQRLDDPGVGVFGLILRRAASIL